MHYSDSYKFLQKINDSKKSAQLRDALRSLEQKINDNSFLLFLKNSSSLEAVYDLRASYDQMRFHQLDSGISEILELIKGLQSESTSEDKVFYDTITLILKDIQETVRKKQTLPIKENVLDYYFLAREHHATHCLPLDQANDPFWGSVKSGANRNHSQKYAELVAAGQIENLLKDETSKENTAPNWSWYNLLFMRIGWYFSLYYSKKLYNALWESLLELNDKTIFNITIHLEPVGTHSSSLRMVGKGIEYYDNYHGLVQFRCRDHAINFLAAHLQKQARTINSKISFMSVYRLPFENNRDYNPLLNLNSTQFIPERDKNREAFLPKSPEEEKRLASLKVAIQCLELHSNKMRNQGNIKAIVKANEIDCLIEELRASTPQEVHARIQTILENKNHTLLVNRGSGFYFFMSGFQSRSTTETLIQKIYEVTTSFSTLSINPS